MPRRALIAVLPLLFFAALSAFLPDLKNDARADVGGVHSSAPTFGPGQPLTITVSAEDDDGTLTITSNLNGSTLTVSNCSGIGADQVAGKCDGTGKSAVSGQGTTTVKINTDGLDTDGAMELVEVTLTLVADCSKETAVTITANQPGNVGPDDVTVNCEPPTPTPTPTPTRTPTPIPTSTPPPTPTPVPPTPIPPTPPPQPLTSTVLTIRPPSTGDGGLAR